MASNSAPLSGGQLVVAALRAHRVEMAFSVAGESYLEVLDALYDAPEIRLVTCRQEGGAAFMAEAYGKLTGKPGVLLVTRGPGACNASIGIHTAFQDSTPMVVLVGQVARHQIDREAFQEVDFRRMFAPLAKWVAQIDLAERVPELMNQAFQVATSGRPGPVVLALPEDMLRDRGRRRGLRPLPRRCAPIPVRPTSPSCAGCWPLPSARSCWSAAAGGAMPPATTSPVSPRPTICRSAARSAARTSSTTVWRVFAGDLGTGASPALVARIKAIRPAAGGRRPHRRDHLAILFAARHPRPRQDADPRPPRRRGTGPRLPPDPGDPVGHARIRRRRRGAARRCPRRAGRAWREAVRAEYEAGLLPSPGTSGGALDLGRIMTWLRQRLPDDAIVTSDAGNFSGWPNRFLQYRRPGRQLGPTSGAMGYGVPAAVAAKLVHPGRLVVGFCGDGGFLMTGQELATSLAEGVGPIILLFNNAMYGTIRMHQERRFPGRVVGTALKNPDFAALARAYGAFAAAVSRTEDFAPAFEEAATGNRAAVIELAIDPELITTRTTLSAIRHQAEARASAKAEARGRRIPASHPPPPAPAAGAAPGPAATAAARPGSRSASA